MPDRDWWQALWSDPLGVLHGLGITPNMKVVDLCCGDGYFTAPLALLVEGKVYAVDLDPELLQLAQAAVERIGATVRHWIHGDARDLGDLIPERVDVVLIANTFHGVPDKTALARGVANVLKPAGHFAIVNWHPLPRERTVVLDQPRGPIDGLRMSSVQVREVVEPAGFKLDRVCELPPYHYGAIFRRSSS